MQQLERMRRRLWTYRQPITRVPAQKAVPISDLFVWRNSEEWETFFELYNIPALLEGETTGKQSIQLTLFNQDGGLLGNHVLTVDDGKRVTISLRNFLGTQSGECGTFAVFHLSYPDSIASLGCFVAERGYVSYKFKNAPLRSYVHGNLDAITLLDEGKFELLGADSLFKREFRLQYLNQDVSSSEFFLVNPTRQTRLVECSFHSAEDGRPLGAREIQLPSGGFRCVDQEFNSDGPVYISIKSKLVMARPLVFTFQNSKMDVFHG